ncbi:MAG: Unknown protein [uncultured Sulfurovum sp.]|uniref:LysM domain-containing protein n=1 Tax=uncultured Sulfurovum sp. TaxID=269237 RepID=A0A6S6TDR8_9BACT|nr:MAG: Unknown protein [uncultured Sulfurovum sp.]
MEIVKRLEGPEAEESFEFEEEYVTPKEEPKKHLLLIMIILFFITIGSYFGYKKFQTKDTASSAIIQEEVTTAKKIEINSNHAEIPMPKEKIEIVEQQIPKNQPMPKEPITKKEVTKEVAVYTEVLAQNILPQSPQQVLTKSPAIQKEPEIDIKITKVKILSPIPQKPIVTKTIIKEPIVKKVIPKKVIVKKVTAKKRVKPKRKPRIVTIKKGDTLALIAQKYYGNAMEFKRIIRANRSIRSEKTSLKLGQKIVVPYLPKHKQRRFVTVKKGYSLAYISKKFYGTTAKVQTIVDANRNIKTEKSTLKIGQKVYVPK